MREFIAFVILTAVVVFLAVIAAAEHHERGIQLERNQA
jgi:hypothetical protein